MEIIKAKDGSDTIRISGTFIHSSYSPVREVEKFFSSTDYSKKGTLIVCGDTLGYIYNFLRNTRPDLKIISILYDDSFRSNIQSPDETVWFPGSSVSLSTFLQSNISLLEIIGTDIISWPASDRSFPDTAKKVHQTINQFLLENSGSLNTVKQFGNLWFRNIIENFLHIENIYKLPHISNCPVVIAASGPSLARGLSFLQRHRQKLFLISLPSSIEALVNNSIYPDLIVQTDPGYYATHHLRILSEHKIPVAMPLSSCRGISKNVKDIFCFSQNSILENRIFDKSAVDFDIIPSSGTVAITALLISLKYFSNSPVFLLGYDFTHDDIHTHIEPNAFMSLFRSQDIRTDPLTGFLYKRSFTDGALQSVSLKTYSGWIKRFSEQNSLNLFRLNPSSVSLGNILDITEEDADSFFYEISDFKSEPNPALLFDGQDRIDICLNILKSFIKEFEDYLLTDVSKKKLFLTEDFLHEILLSLKPAETLKLKKNANILNTDDFNSSFDILIKESASMLELYIEEYFS